MRDAQGEATGALQESADNLIDKFTPKPTQEERLAALRLGMHQANKFGLVRVHSAGGDFEWLDLYDQLRQKQELSLRFYIAYFLDPPELKPDEIEKIEQARRTYDDAWISGGVVKTMLDGVVEAHTAAMLEPYSDDPTKIGKMFWDSAKYKQAVAELDRRGLQIFTHAIGDKAVRLALDAYQGAAETNHTRDMRPRSSTSRPSARRTFRASANSESWPASSPCMPIPMKTRWASGPQCGQERAQRAWVWHSIESTGGVLAFGSDWPVVTLNPWPGVQNALTGRQRKAILPAALCPRSASVSKTP